MTLYLELLLLNHSVLGLVSLKGEELGVFLVSPFMSSFLLQQISYVFGFHHFLFCVFSLCNCQLCVCPVLERKGIYLVLVFVSNIF